MLTAPRPEPVREAQEILLIDRVEHFHHCPLDDFVLQCGDGGFIMHLSKLSVGMMGLKMSRVAHPFAKFRVLRSTERDPPRATAVELARFDDAAFNPVIDDVYADAVTICNLSHGKFFWPLERD